jgi:folate-binding protein YgfZ
MSAPRLIHRTIVRLSPLDDSEDVAAFLQGLVTSDVKGPLPVWTGLLNPQGKALFDFIVWADGPEAGGDLLLDCEAAAAAALAKRLALYRLRRRIAIAQDSTLGVFWQREGEPTDPRLPALGHRWIAPVSADDVAVDDAWRAHRLAHGVPEGLAELGSEQTLWLETNAAELNGVSFTKGCYVGQENTARMNWRQKVNRRLVVVPMAKSDAARQRAAYAQLGLAVDHRRVEDIPAELAPSWMEIT